MLPEHLRPSNSNVFFASSMSCGSRFSKIFLPLCVVGFLCGRMQTYTMKLFLRLLWSKWVKFALIANTYRIRSKDIFLCTEFCSAHVRKCVEISGKQQSNSSCLMEQQFIIAYWMWFPNQQYMPCIDTSMCLALALENVMWMEAPNSFILSRGSPKLTFK